MFWKKPKQECEACKARSSEIENLRALVGKLLVSQNPQIMHIENPGSSQTGYYGDGQDLLDVFDPYGFKQSIPEGDMVQKKGS